ncbi:MAG: topoisomerase DNA-binding C4 zinc finger domain-containing protein, partial [Lachnospiraceae bacterium]|nr:topoisomerase DNA-binding C4 zinc finger domain-containing protein [Lachnospiraceae bacterium]
KSVRRCPKCGEILKRRNGRYGQFWGCSGYPDCRYTENA